MPRILVFSILAVVAAGCSDHVSIPTDTRASAPVEQRFSRSVNTPIAGRYIVVFKNSVRDIDGEAKALGVKHSGKVLRTFKAALHGMTLDLSDIDVAALRAESSVAYIEQDQTISISVDGRFDAVLTNGGSAGLCLTGATSSTSFAAAAMTSCNGTPNQLLTLPPIGTAGTVTLSGGAMCLDAYGGGSRAGDVVGDHPCNGGAGQSWTLTAAGALVGGAGLCATVSGTGISQQPCAGTASQRWTATTPITPPPPSGRFDAVLTNGGTSSGQCLTGAISSTSFAAAAMSTCNGTAGQLLTLPPIGTTGIVTLVSGAMCLDAYGGGSRAADDVGDHPCNGSAGQSWTLTAAGALIGSAGLCATVIGTSVTQQPCAGTASQRWTATTPTTPPPPPPPSGPATVTQSNADWGLDRMDQRSLPLNGTYTYSWNGTSVTVYVIDSGINFIHQEFGGRATAGVDEITVGGNASDCNGHGTHVSGTIGGATYGVAKQVRIVSVRVLDCSGSGSTSGVIAGIDWVTATRTLPAVANMSLGGGFSQALNDAVERSIAMGVTYVVAAGNSTADACTTSPASAPNALTVGATDITDTFASFSNYGSCVALSAPGVRIASSWIGSHSAINTLSGTSMSSPHVAGAVAIYLQQNPAATPAQVRAALIGNATSGVIKSIGAGTTNLLLYTPGASTP